MPLPTQSELENFLVTDSGAPYVVYAIGPTQDFEVTDSGAPFVVNEMTGDTPEYLWGAAVVRTASTGAGAATTNHFGHGVVFVVGAGFLPVSADTVDLWGAAELSTSVGGEAHTSGGVTSVTTAHMTALGNAGVQAVAAGEPAVPVVARMDTTHDMGAVSAAVATVTAMTWVPALVSLWARAVSTVRAIGRIVRIVPAPVLGVRVLDTRAGIVTAAHDSVAVRMVGQQAASCARVG